MKEQTIRRAADLCARVALSADALEQILNATGLRLEKIIFTTEGPRIFMQALDKTPAYVRCYMGGCWTQDSANTTYNVQASVEHLRKDHTCDTDAIKKELNASLDRAKLLSELFARAGAAPVRTCVGCQQDHSPAILCEDFVPARTVARPVVRPALPASNWRDDDEDNDLHIGLGDI